MTVSPGTIKELDQASTICRRYTVADLARMLGVSPARIRRWVQHGLLTPVESQHRLAFFDFRQASLARRLSDLAGRGRSLASLRAGLDQLRRWLPENHLPLEQNGRLLVRLSNRLVDGGGQQYFDFAAFDDSQATLAPCFQAREVGSLFEAALELEDVGRLAEAAALYRRAIDQEPNDPVLHFNLGNVLFGQGHFADALASYQRALRADPQYAEAWNNLGNAWAELSRPEEAMRAFRKALQLVPGYELAKSNLADLVGQLRPPVRLRLVCAEDA